MKKITKATAALLTVAAVGVLNMPTASAHYVGHVWCAVDGQCPEIAYANGHYWMTKQRFATTWVRLTKVPGWNNSHVAPITCETYSVCRIQYYDAFQANGYWMAERDDKWVRLTEI